MKRDYLLNELRKRIVEFGDFTLSSGSKSNYYLDCRKALVNSKLAYLIGEMFFYQSYKLGIDAIGGLETAAIPIVTATVIAYHNHGYEIEGFWVKNKTKDHGMKKLIEGNLTKDANILIVDDVLTTGASFLKVYEVLKEYKIKAMLALINREMNLDDMFKKTSIPTDAIFNAKDFV